MIFFKNVTLFFNLKINKLQMILSKIKEFIILDSLFYYHCHE